MGLRADPPRELDVSVGHQDEPWEGAGFHSRVEVGREWREHEFYFIADGARPGRVRGPLIAAGDAEGAVWVRDVVFRPAD